jgi:hypothetical protein
VYWNKSGTDRFGKTTYDAPVELAVRWDGATKEFKAADGTTKMSSSMVMVGIDTPVGGFLWEGRLTAIVDPLVPQNNVGAMRIERLDTIPNLRNTEIFRQAYL